MSRGRTPSSVLIVDFAILIAVTIVIGTWIALGNPYP